jgi:hypothetical protein
MPTESDTDSSEEKKRRDSAELKRVLPVWWGLKKAAQYIAPRTKKATRIHQRGYDERQFRSVSRLSCLQR